MAIKNYKGNETFKVGRNQDLNACVGNNGFNDIGTYEYGYDKAVNILVDAAKNDHGIVDPIIYPLIFSARHRIELFLKKSIYALEEIYKTISRKIVYLNYLPTHDIKRLWEHLKTLCEIDCRYKDVVLELSSLIEDYYIIDLTGETFRYPYDKNDVHHLDDFSCINIGIFKRQYDKASELMDNITYINNALLEEYKTGTFIDGLSRVQLEEISKMLPSREEWTNPSFDEIRERIKSTYSISGRALSRALNIIQKHREFSNNFGAIIPVTELTYNDYIVFRTKFNEFHSLEKGKEYFKYKNKYATDICSLISAQAIYSLMTFEEIGYFSRYSEDYDPLLKHYSNEESLDILFMRLMDSKRIPEWIEKGMVICGQSHFLK